MKTLSVTTKHIQTPSNNFLRYTFPSNVNLSNHQIGLASLSLFYSFYNISSKKNNNKFQYIWDGTTHDVELPNLTGEISDINNYLQFIFRSRNHYMINASGDPVYFVEMVVDKARYAIAIITTQVPNAFNSTYPQASNSHFTLPSNAFMPVIKMIDTSKFNELIGFTNTFQTSATLATNHTALSSSAPVLNPDSNIIVVIQNMIDNQYSSPNGVIHSFGISANIGEQILEKPSEISYNDIMPSHYDHLDIRILNADTLEDVEILDPEISILLLIREKS